MPTFTGIALDRLIDTGSQKTMAGVKNGPDVKLDRRYTTSSTLDNGVCAPRTKLEKAVSIPTGKLHMRNVSSDVAVERKYHWTQISPALYATPEPTPVPDSPSSFPPSPYIINHKRRGPRLLKSFSEDDIGKRNQAPDEKRLEEKVKDTQKEGSSSTYDSNASPGKVIESPQIYDPPSPVHSLVEEKSANGISNGKLIGTQDLASCSVVENSMSKSDVFSVQRDSEADDFFDPQESMSVKSSAESESNSLVERSLNVATPLAEFYDAWEVGSTSALHPTHSSELSSETGPQPSLPDFEVELREVRLSLLMEIGRRNQAEESLQNTRAQWQRIREELSVVGLTLAVDLVAASEDLNPIRELSQQFDLARFVSNSIGRGTAKAEVEMEMEAQMELKNFEIARLLDRLHYYEAVNREMSQRNQETIEVSRRLRQRRKRRQRWIWGSVAAAITVGASVVAWSYFPTGKGSSTNLFPSPEGDHTSEQ